MNPIPPFSVGQIETLSRLLGECGTGDQITRAFRDRDLEDHSGQSTKWRRLHWVFSDSQRQHGCANRIIDFIQSFLEASKGLAQRIRDLSGIEGDGAALVDKVFSIDNPILALNFLKSDTEKSEHKGFAQLLKGCFAAVRNPLAHEPKILWDGEEDAADYFTLISLLHRRLDGCFRTSPRL